MARKDIKFPSISRIINDRNIISVGFGSLFILVAILLVGYDLHKTYDLNKEQTAKKQSLLKEERFWKIALNKYSDYRDGYLSLAKVDYELGDKKSAMDNVEKALSIDPNYEISINFEKILEGN